MQHSNECEYRSILVPLDGSDAAEHALPTALSFARRRGAALHVVRVYVPIAGVYGEHAVPYDETLDRELMKRAREYLDAIVARLAVAAGVRATSAMVEASVADAISRHATTVGADLIVMTTQGRGPLARFWFGSVSDELVRQAGVPILFVRPQEAAAELAREPLLRRVLIPLDGSALAESILQPVLALTDRAETEYTLLQVVAPVGELDYGPARGKITGFPEAIKQLHEIEKAESDRARAYLARLAAPLRARSLVVHTRVISAERPATAILNDISVHATDLITLATHGRGELKRLILGSVADKVLRGATSPVLVYRPAGVSRDN
jgi:nucleotide-binding universal stress UspA family protein